MRQNVNFISRLHAIEGEVFETVWFFEISETGFIKCQILLKGDNITLKLVIRRNKERYTKHMLGRLSARLMVLILCHYDTSLLSLWLFRRGHLSR